eukprot:gene23172-35507_t
MAWTTVGKKQAKKSGNPQQQPHNADANGTSKQKKKQKQQEQERKANANNGIKKELDSGYQSKTACSEEATDRSSQCSTAKDNASRSPASKAAGTPRNEPATSPSLAEKHGTLAISADQQVASSETRNSVAAKKSTASDTNPDATTVLNDDEKRSNSDQIAGKQNGEDRSNGIGTDAEVDVTASDSCQQEDAKPKPKPNGKQRACPENGRNTDGAAPGASTDAPASQQKVGKPKPSAVPASQNGDGSTNGHDARSAQGTTTGANPEPKATKPKPKSSPAASSSENANGKTRPTPGASQQNGAEVKTGVYKFALDMRPCGYQMRGIYNTRNSCYQSSLIQALAACPPFLQMVKALPQQLPTMPVLKALREVFFSFKPTTATASPISALPLLQAMSPRFTAAAAGRQADAGEYLLAIFDEMSEEFERLMPELAGQRRKAMVTRGKQNGWETAGRGGVEHITGSVNNGPIAELFEGTLSSRLTSRGAKPSVTLQPFNILPVDIIDTSRPTSIERFIVDWTAPQAVDLLSGEGATKQVSFSSLPPLLVVCLKLWCDGSQKASFSKNITINTTLTVHPSVTTLRKKLAADDAILSSVADVRAAKGEPYLLFYSKNSEGKPAAVLETRPKLAHPPLES